MRTLARVLAVLPLLQLSACGPEPAPAWHGVESPALGIRFSHPDAITSAKQDPAASGDEWATPSGPAYGFVVDEGDAPGEAGKWALPAGFSQGVSEEPSCELLQESGVYLPVLSTEAFACDVVELDDGQYAFYLIGIGRAQESYAFLESLVLVPREGHTLVLQGIAPLAAYPAAAEELFAANPDVEYGTPEFDRVQTELLNILRLEIDPPTPATDNAMTALWKIAQSLRAL